MKPIKENKRGNIMLEDVPKLLFLNFAGNQTQYNREGDRNFGVLLRPEWVEEFQERGLNVKWLKPREEQDEPAAWVKVKVNFNSPWPPEVILITERGRTTLDSHTASTVDKADIAYVDLVLNASPYDVNGSTGITLYLVTAYITINEDDFERKYSLAQGPEQPSSGVHFE